MINKIKNNIKKYGFLKTIKRGCIKIYHVVKTRIYNLLFDKKYSKELEKILSNNGNKTIVVMHPFFDYNMPNFQRFQQLGRAIGNMNSYLFFYCTPNNIYDSIYGFKNIKNNLYLTNQYDRIINSNIKNIKIIFSSTDMNYSYKDIEYCISNKYDVIYDYVDEIDESIVGKVSISQYKRHEDILKNENIKVIVTADKLFDEVSLKRKNNFKIVTNGVNIDDFNLDNIENVPKIILDIKNRFSKIILYYGALASWFDYELLKKCAKRYSNYCFLLIGIKYDMSYDLSKINELENIKFIGKIKYNELINYAKYADLLTIPFLINEVTLSTSPVKLFEYMAISKPILTTNLPECRKYNSVNIACSHEEYLNKIDECINMINDKEYIKNLKIDAINNSWEKKSKEILE